jgi:ABC-type polysaccharide transport system permease subunit
MLVGGTAAFFGVALMVLVSTYVSPVWAILWNALPFGIIISALVMQKANIDPGRIRGLLVTNGMSCLACTLFMSFWLILLFYGPFVPVGKGVWQGLGIAILVYIAAVSGVIAMYFVQPKFKLLIDNGTTVRT